MMLYSYVIWLIVLAGVIAILAVVVKQLGIKIPPFVIQILWIVFAVLVGIVAIKLIMGMI